MTRPTLRIGLTGSIGMGKSTALLLFSEHGLPTWSADEAVHQLYAGNPDLAAQIGRVFPDAVQNSVVSRTALKATIADQSGSLEQLEAIVHPFVYRARSRFLSAHQNAPAVVLEVPLLFETGVEDTFDIIAVVTTDPETQRARVLSRPGMTEDHFQRLLQSQMPDHKKRARADFLIRSDTLATARSDVRDILNTLGVETVDA